MNTDFSNKWTALSSASISNATGCDTGVAASYATCTRTVTHCDLGLMVSGGTFREDWYYRLSTFPDPPALAARTAR